MSETIPIRTFVLCMAAIAMPAQAGVPVRLTGSSAADTALQHDILQQITLFGTAFDCPAPSSARASRLNASMIPPSAPYRVRSLKASYEEWDADFCGATKRFFVAFWPDPAGGSFLSVQHPYPAGAPSAVLP